MLQEHDDRLRVIRARTILDMLGERPATGRDLFRPLRGLDNAALLVRGGRVLDVLPWKSVRVPAATPVTDMGDVTLMPGCINAHCHLQLSHTAGRTLFGAGFTAWLRSLIALLREEHDGTALALACRDMAQLGYPTLYLLTDHTAFYERYGWEYLCPVRGDGEEQDSRMYIHRQTEK